MNRTIRRCVLGVLLAISPPAVAQEAGPPGKGADPEPEVLIPKTARHGFWGGPFMQVSTLRDRAAVFAGGRGGWLLDGRLTLGGGGCGLVNRVRAPAAAGRPGDDLDLAMGYGGGWLEYTFSPLRLLHVSVGTLVGGGQLSLNWRGGGAYGSGSEGFFVAEPAVTAELNLARAVRLDVGAAYRWIVGVDMPGLSTSDVAGLSLVVMMKFGRF
jgi:hypothetical protein